jgi:hypothetical protein
MTDTAVPVSTHRRALTTSMDVEYQGSFFRTNVPVRSSWKVPWRPHAWGVLPSAERGERSCFGRTWCPAVIYSCKST